MNPTQQANAMTTAPSAALADRLDRIESQLSAIQSSLEALHTQQQADRRTRDELLSDIVPITRGAITMASTHLSRLEADGTIAFGRAGLRVLKKVSQAYTTEDVDELGDAITAILDTTRALTRPEVLALAQEAGEVLEHAEDAPPQGLVGLALATREVNVQKGLGILVAGLRHVGRASRVLGKKARQVQGPVSGETRKSAPRSFAAPQPPTTCVPRATTAPVQRPTAAPSVFAPEGFAFDSEGFLTDASTWTEDLAHAIASDLGLPPLTADQLALVQAARTEFASSGNSPNIRRLSAVSGCSVKEIYTLFPHAPGKTVARVAGLPKPVGCI